MLLLLESSVARTQQLLPQMTGGEYFKLGSERNLEQDVTALGNHLPNRYTLSFHSHAPHSGPHVLTLKLLEYAGLKVTARTSYRAEAAR